MFYRLFALFLAGCLAWGQTATAPSGATQRLAKMAQQLQLTEPQKEKIMPILIEEAPKAKAIKEDTTLPQTEKLAKLMQVRNETNDKIRPILTPDQQQKFDQMKQQQRQQMMRELKNGKNTQ